MDGNGEFIVPVEYLRLLDHPQIIIHNVQPDEVASVFPGRIPRAFENERVTLRRLAMQPEKETESATTQEMTEFAAQMLALSYVTSGCVLLKPVVVRGDFFCHVLSTWPAAEWLDLFSLCANDGQRLSVFALAVLQLWPDADVMRFSGIRDLRDEDVSVAPTRRPIECLGETVDKLRSAWTGEAPPAKVVLHWQEGTVRMWARDNLPEPHCHLFVDDATRGHIHAHACFFSEDPLLKFTCVADPAQ